MRVLTSIDVPVPRILGCIILGGDKYGSEEGSNKSNREESGSGKD